MFKRKRDEPQQEVSETTPTPSLLKMDDSARLDTPFPRGGGTGVTPLEIRQATAQATRDVYDETKATKKRKSKTKTVKLPVASRSDKPRVEYFALSKLKIGALVLGEIAEIHQAHIVVSLPNNVIGFLQGLDTSLYQVGEWLRCIVAGMGEAPSKRLQLVIEPELVNQTISQDDYMPGMSIQGTVTSVEDRGYLLDIGSKSAFLPKSAAISELKQGKTILCTIQKEKNGVYTLTQSNDKFLATVHEQASLVPGVKLATTVSNALKGGYMCSIFGHIDISVESLHAGSELIDNSSEDARVLFSHPGDGATDTKRVLGLCMLQNTVELTTPSDAKAFKPGQIIDVAKVIRVIETGLFLDIGLPRPAFVHISNLIDGHVEDISTYGIFKPGTVHKARVLSYSYVDDIYYLTTQPSVLAQQFLKIDEIEAGDVCQAQVERFLPKGGVIISLGQGLKAICPEYYLSDIPLQNPEKKFKSGQKVTVRVLSANPEENKLKVAIKKSIVNTDAQIIKDYPPIGTKSVGTIVSIKERGAVIEFFNNIKGYLPIKEMSESTITNPKSHFKLGQTILVNVLDSNPETDRLVVSCRASRSVSNAPKPVAGELTKAVVTERLADAFAIQINGHSATLPFELVADKSNEVKAAKKAVKIGSTIEVLVLQSDYNATIATMKPTLLKHQPPASLVSYSKGDQVYGYVKAVGDHGVFVAFANNLVGLLPKAIMGDKSYTQGDTIQVYLSSVDHEKNRCLVSTENPVRASNGTSDGLKVGDEVTATVTAVKQTQLNVVVGETQGRIEMTQLFDSIDEVEDVKQPLQQFSKGDKIKCRVIGYHDARNHKFLPISHRTGTHIVLELSALEGGLRDKFEIGSKALAFINNFNDAKDSCYVNLTPTIRSRLALSDLTSDLAELENLDESFPIGRVIETEVYSSSPVKISAVGCGNALAIVQKVMPLQLVVKLSRGRTCLVAATDSANVYKPLAKAFSVGQIAAGKVIEVDESNDKTWISLQTAEAKDKPAESIEELKTGDIVHGFVKNVADGGLFVQLGRHVTGRVQISQLSDSYLKDWKKGFKVGQVVEAKVVSKPDGKRVELTLKKSAISGKAESQTGLEDLEIGSILSGKVRNVQEYGIFVSLDGLNMSGLCHRSEVADKTIEDLNKVFTKGDAVKVKVLDVDMEKRKISLGMKASYFDDEEDSDEDAMDEDEQDSEEDAAELDSDESDDSEDDDAAMEITDFNEIALPSDDSDDSESDSDSESNAGDGVSAGFDWNADILDQREDSDSDSSDDESEGPRKRKRTEKFVQDKTATLNSRAPQSAQDFERLLVANPDSSVMWMNYMAFQIQLSEIDAAREIARRALKSIPIREEQEKQNIWIALLNLENSFGTSETTEDMFKEACTFMDPLTMHQKMAGIYAASDKVEDANRVWNAACKKFGNLDVNVWAMYGKFLFDSGNAEGARKLLDRAVRVLPTRSHKDLTLQFAKLEYSIGDSERGRTLMEGLVSAYPRKIDVWNVYVDQEMKTPENRAMITRLFERILKLKLSTKQAKLFFKKWLSFEVEHGDTKGVDYVKAKAQQYVNGA